jgi:hypothetical protein
MSHTGDVFFVMKLVNSEGLVSDQLSYDLSLAMLTRPWVIASLQRSKQPSSENLSVIPSDLKLTVPVSALTKVIEKAHRSSSTGIHRFLRLKRAVSNRGLERAPPR